MSKSTPQTKYHLLTTRELTEIRISDRSWWTDIVWYIAIDTRGYGEYLAVRWDFQVGIDKFHLRYPTLCTEVKRFLWSLLVDPREIGRARKPLSVDNIMVGVRFFVRWMVENSYTSFIQLDDNATADFLADLPRRYSDASIGALPAEASLEDDIDDVSDDVVGELDAGREVQPDVDTSIDDVDAESDSELSLSGVMNRLNTLWYLYWQRNALADAGVTLSIRPPYGDVASYKLAKSITAAVVGQIPPVPDEVVIPILKQAIRLLGTPADDVTNAAKATIHAFNSATAKFDAETAQISIGESATSASYRYKQCTAQAAEVLVGWNFSTLAGESSPWACPLAYAGKTSLPSDFNDGYEGEVTPSDGLKDLIYAIRDANVILIQCLVGLRINEICGLDGGTDPVTGLPVCVEIRRSRNGIEELFYLKGRLSKLRSQVVETEWLIGSRPVGSTLLPLPVQALLELEKVFAPWRALSDCRALVLHFSNNRGVPRSGDSISPAKTVHLLKGQRAFISSRVDFSSLQNQNRRNENLRPYKESLGRCIRTHQWRKTYAHYILETRASLLPALSQHFKHLSIAMTEQGYKVADPYIRRSMEAASMSATVSFIMEAAHGERVAGRMAELVEIHKAELLKITNGNADAAYRQVEKWVRLHDIRIFFGDHGKCLIALAPLSARCHQLSGTESWRNIAPNMEHRAPTVCCGCMNHVIDAEHIPFWIERHRSNSKVFSEAMRDGRARDFRVAQARARQAAMVLHQLGVAVEDV